MAFFDDVYNRLFGKKSKNDPKLLHEVLERSQGFKDSYDQWINNDLTPSKIGRIKSSYELKKKGIEQSPEVHILNSQYANGIAISYSDFFDRNEFSYLIDYMAEKILALGYKKANSDVKISVKNTYTESVEKHYLKPVTGMDSPLDQKYGNILLESVKVDDRPSYFKLSANVYSDRLYKTALPFENLINELL